MVERKTRQPRNRRFSVGLDARQLAAAFFLVAALIVVSALLGQGLGPLNIIILSAMVAVAMGLGLWYLIFHGLRRAASGNLELLLEVISTSPEGRLITTRMDCLWRLIALIGNSLDCRLADHGKHSRTFCRMIQKRSDRLAKYLNPPYMLGPQTCGPTFN